VTLAAALGAAACVGTVRDGDSAPTASPTNPSDPGTGQPPQNPADPSRPPPQASDGKPGNPTGSETLSVGPVRRLTRAQYANTVRDLLGVEVGETAAGFGLDELDGGFASNAKAPLKELQIEKYLEGADALAAKASADLDRLVPCHAGPEAACLDEFIPSFGKRAYRRPLTPVEVDRYRQLFAAGKNGGDFKSGITLVVSTMLQSPYFLYRPELGDSSAAEKDGLPLTAYETAARLSYFLQNTMPDEQLFAAADAGKLRTPEELAAQARRLLESEKARDTITSFYLQWLELEELEAVEKDPNAYPGFTPELRTAMKEEVVEFVDHVSRKADGKLATLLTAKYSFLKGPLFGLYGVPAKTGTTPTQVDLPAAQRAGVLTLASVMARHAHPDQSSPVGRGYVVSDKLLCVVPPPPPDDVDADIPKPDPNVSTRERFAMHREKPQCASCHTLMDPLGLPFEIYDGIGRFRTNDGKRAVDATGELRGTDADGPVKDATELAARLSRASQVQYCMARQWFRYAFGRLDLESDKNTIAIAHAAFARAEHKLPELLVALTTTRAFRYRALLDQ
jgi:hypothetical protein